MIILYGNYASGEHGVVAFYQSDLDILVICDTGDAVKAENRARDIIVPKYDKLMEGKRHPAPPQIIVENTTTINLAIRRNIKNGGQILDNKPVHRFLLFL